MLDNTDPTKSVWIDHDIRNPKIVSVGCHAVYPEIDVNPLSFNPHRFYNQHPDKCFKGKSGNGRDKFPFSTSVLLAHAFGWLPEDDKSIMFLSHADSGYKVYNDYFNNVRAWSDVFFDDNLKKIKNTNPEPMYESLKLAGYKGESYQKSSVNISNETNYINNIRKMSKFINDHIKMPEIRDIVSTTKFITGIKKFGGKLDSDTFEIASKSLSYAVIYRNELSYTVGAF